jgi:hypothetical protein
MAINGSPSMAQVATEFGGGAPHALSEYRGVREFGLSDDAKLPDGEPYIQFIMDVEDRMK